MSEPKRCSWCGAAMRGRAVCPRGPACEKEEANHFMLLERIAEEEAKTSRKKRK